MRKFYRIRCPETAHPLVRRLFAEMNRQQIGVLDMAERSSVSRNTLKNWRYHSNPNVVDLDACFGVLGMRLDATYRRDDG